MKKIAFLVVLLLAVAFLLFGCTDSTQQNVGGLMGLDVNNSTSISEDKSTNTYNNLSDFKKVQVGDKVSVNYTGRFEDGKIFDSSIGKSPLEFTAGAGQMIKGFDAAVIGMKVGEKKTVTLQPADAYGEYQQSKIVTLDKNNFLNFDELIVGMTVSAGNGLNGIVKEKNDTTAIIDFNPEMAGKTLVFEIEMLSID